MKKTYTVKLTFKGTTVPVLDKLQLRMLIANAINDWFVHTRPKNDEEQWLILSGIQVTAEEIDTE